MKSTDQIKELARQHVAAGLAPNIDDAISRVVSERPDLYRKSLEEKDDDHEFPEELKAALATLSADERAEVERKATEIFLKGQKCTQADSLIMAIQQTPGVHLKCSSAAPVRKDTMEKIRKMREANESNGLPAWMKLKEIASSYHSNAVANDIDDAWCKACEDYPELFQEWQDSQPKANQGSSGKQVHASDFEGKAKALVSAGHAKDIDDAYGMVAASDPAAYSEYLKTLS